MPSLTALRFGLPHLLMETDNKKTETQSGVNSRLHLQIGSTRTRETEGLSLEEMTQWSHSLERLLTSKSGIKIFQAFLKSEFSDENLEFWLVCEEFKKIKCSFRMSSRAKKIFKRYIQAEATREINIDHKTRELIRKTVKTPSTTCFSEAQRIVYGLMEKDSYQRFLKSDLYRTLLESATESTVV